MKREPNIQRLNIRVRRSDGRREGVLLYIAANGLARVRWDGNKSDTYLAPSRIEPVEAEASDA